MDEQTEEQFIDSLGEYLLRSDFRKLNSLDILNFLKSEEFHIIKSGGLKYPEPNIPVLARLKEIDTEEEVYAVLKHVLEDDCSWRTLDDNSELDYAWNVITWYSLPSLNKGTSHD